MSSNTLKLHIGGVVGNIIPGVVKGLLILSVVGEIAKGEVTLLTKFVVAEFTIVDSV
jgi:hypothetical protein